MNGPARESEIICGDKGIFHTAKHEAGGVAWLSVVNPVKRGTSKLKLIVKDEIKGLIVAKAEALVQYPRR